MTDTQKIVKRDSLSKQVSDKLETMIESGMYEIGQKIPTESELMQIFEVSRNTIREAVRSLTWSGILEVKQGDGTYVRSSSRFHANMKQKYAQVSLEDITEARNCIEVTIAHMAAMRRQEEDINKITMAYAKRKELKAGCKENTKADIEFHMAIAEACHNSILIDLYQSISDYLESHIAERNLDSQIDFEKIDQLHEELFYAVIDQNADLASTCAENILKI